MTSKIGINKSCDSLVSNVDLRCVNIFLNDKKVNNFKTINNISNARDLCKRFTFTEVRNSEGPQNDFAKIAKSKMLEKCFNTSANLSGLPWVHVFSFRRRCAGGRTQRKVAKKRINLHRFMLPPFRVFLV
uniref:Uncharacterized protein n=1 Tax=Romanomermis culicivorax TaxID=13658 RepID=A0A915JD30_ROMCU